MTSNRDISNKIEAVKIALAEHLKKEKDDQLKSFEVISTDTRSFSTIVYIRIRTVKANKRLVIKTVNHHPINKIITERENQAVVEYNILRNLHPKFLTVDKCSVPAPVLVIPEIETFLTEFIEGSLLINEFRYARYFSSHEKFKVLKDHYYQCGRWLRHFQEFTELDVAGEEALHGVVDRCDYRLRLIEDSRDSRCPKNLREKVMEYVYEQLSQLKGEEISVSGRHGDFGSWNILVGSEGVTVIDFLGHGRDPIAVDILKMLMNFEDEKKYLTYSRHRIDALKRCFLEGFGPLPLVQEPVLMICETFHRICSVLSCLTSKDKRFRRRIESHLCLKANLEWLTNGRKRKLLWPNCNYPC